jgi:signal transduction histidine kinase
VSRLFGGLRGRVTLTVFAVTAVLYAVAATLLFLRIVDTGRDTIERRVDDVLDRMETDLRAGVSTLRVETADGVSAVLVDVGHPVSERAGELVVERRIDVGGRDGLLIGRASVRALNDGLRSLHVGLWLAVPLAAAFTALVAGMATGRALRPVDDITELAARIGPEAVERVPVPDTGDEIERLALTVNAMLERISEGRQAQERFTSDAAHELRTPLMALHGEIELIALGRGDAESNDRMARQAERLEVLVDDLVLLATLDEGRPLDAQTFELLAFLRGEIDAIVPTAALHDPDLTDASNATDDPEGTAAPDSTITADRRLLGRAVDNLLANARRHAVERVAVVVERDSVYWSIHVDDDGPGLADERAAEVFGRFGRLDEARSIDGGGSGLGLAIVDAVTRSHGGTVCAGRSEWGGARLTIRLPRER